MAFTDQDTCTVPECGRPCSNCANLCKRQWVPGIVVCFNSGSGIVTVWYAEREDESGPILVSNWTLLEQYVRGTYAAIQPSAEEIPISAVLGTLGKGITDDLKHNARDAVRRG